MVDVELVSQLRRLVVHPVWRASSAHRSSLVAAISLALWGGCLGAGAAVLAQRLPYIVALVKPPLVVSADIAFIRSSIDQLAVCGSIPNHC